MLGHGARGLGGGLRDRAGAGDSSCRGYYPHPRGVAGAAAYTGRYLYTMVQGNGAPSRVNQRLDSPGDPGAGGRQFPGRAGAAAAGGQTNRRGALGLRGLRPHARPPRDDSAGQLRLAARPLPPLRRADRRPLTRPSSWPRWPSPPPRPPCIQAGPDLWITCILGWWLLTLAWIDADSFRLPDALTLPLILAGLGEALWRDPDQLTARAAGAAIAYTALWALAAFYRRLRGREGLGMGDAKLLAAGGAWLGVVPLPDVLLLAACSALAYALLRGAEIRATLKVPFGPFLAGAIWLAWLWGAT